MINFETFKKLNAEEKFNLFEKFTNKTSNTHERLDTHEKKLNDILRNQETTK